MNHIIDADFWEYCTRLPSDIQRRVPQKFTMLQNNPKHPSLRFKKVGNLWSIRIYKGYRALAREKNNTFIWYWIGNHEEYIRRIQSN